MMHQGRFIRLQQIYHLGDADNRGCCACVRQRVYRKSPYVLLNFAGNLKLL